MKLTRQILTWLYIAGLAFGVGIMGGNLLAHLETGMILSAGMLVGAALMFLWHHWSLKEHLRIERERLGDLASEASIRQFKAGFIVGKLSKHQVIEPVSIQGGVWRN